MALGQAAPADPARVEDIHEASKDVMPFDMTATQHIFRKTGTGGVQTVVTRRSDEQQTALVRQHLIRIAQQFSERDFGGPTHVHGAAMPGLEEMRAAKPDQLRVTYRDVDNGGELTYWASTPELIDAVHRWFDAQVSDHGPDAKAGQ